MRRSKKLSLSGPEVTASIEEGETKEIEYENHKYSYRVDRFTLYKDYYALEVTGGPFGYRATTTCKKPSIKKRLRNLILSLKHK